MSDNTEHLYRIKGYDSASPEAVTIDRVICFNPAKQAAGSLFTDCLIFFNGNYYQGRIHDTILRIIFDSTKPLDPEEAQRIAKEWKPKGGVDRLHDLLLFL